MHYMRWYRHGATLPVRPTCPPVECSVDGCKRPADARGYCTLHYQRWLAHGDPTVVTPKQQPWPDRRCTVEGCDELRKTSKLYCEKHRARMRRHGDPSIALKDHTPAVERWKTSYEVDPVTGCWTWIGQIYKTRAMALSRTGPRSVIWRIGSVWEQIVGPLRAGIRCWIISARTSGV